MRMIILACSIVVVLSAIAASYSLGRCFYKENFFKISLASKIKFVLMALCPISLLYAAYVLYFREKFILATLISLVATGVVIVIDDTNLKR